MLGEAAWKCVLTTAHRKFLSVRETRYIYSREKRSEIVFFGIHEDGSVSYLFVDEDSQVLAFDR